MVGFADGRVSGAAAGATGVIEFQFENLNENTIKTTPPDGTSSPDYQIYGATHILHGSCVSVSARVAKLVSFAIFTFDFFLFSFA